MWRGGSRGKEKESAARYTVKGGPCGSGGNSGDIFFSFD